MALLSYVNRDREITKKYVQHAEKRGVRALFITVDAPQLGRREKDMRMKVVDDSGTAKVQDGQKDVKKDQGISRAISVWIHVFILRRSNNMVTSLSLTPAYHGKIFLGLGVLPIVSIYLDPSFLMLTSSTTSAYYPQGRRNPRGRSPRL